MFKFTSSLMDIFSYTAYFVYLNLLWLLFSALGLGLFGIAPATASLITLTSELREEKNYHGIRKFWDLYKSCFFKTNTYFLLSTFFFCLLLLNFRITNVFLGGNQLLNILYLAAGVFGFFIIWNLFFNIAKNPELTTKENFSLSLFMLTRFPHLNLTNVLSVYALWLLISQKSSLLLLCGATVLCYFTEFFHSRMIEKTKQLKKQWDTPCSQP
ncbi:DUF624 domain-containing protein [Enterococcus sp. BWB1-3]|uniref:DUF624 domain-containing protein n=1 Tax=unclassified Enterococcus TaxID=2608891 RepID=UPI001923A371|nr:MULTISPECIES: DUF624 domain-containing protein [unclassified Enterococcus]MBL1230172.1 DUF624 domain-containing protein [Enterococcus sp. BWB1-3]MCB5953172.1 DUF624 domain-containing protein [Enterococcus sp. BWT-B8]MCB5953785.1 DUF624 domain-containing protein [Enterococcus sp. CWB-B31]